MNRRQFLGSAALGAGVAVVGCGPAPKAAEAPVSETPPTPQAIRDLKPMRDGIVPISADERKGRIAKAQQLMAEQKIDAIFMEGTHCSGSA